MKAKPLKPFRAWAVVEPDGTCFGVRTTKVGISAMWDKYAPLASLRIVPVEVRPITRKRKAKK